MNPWKVSFFLLAGIVLAAVVYLFSVVAAVSESDPLPSAKPDTGSYNALTVQTTRADFEGIANTYIYRAMEKDAKSLAQDHVLTAELIERLIERIEIDHERNIRVSFRFKSEFQGEAVK